MAIKIIGSTIIDDSRNIVNAGIATVTSVSIGNTQVVSSARQLQNIASLDATTTATIEAAIQNAPNTFTDLTVTGISTLGVTSATNLTAQQLNISGVSTLGITTFTNIVSFGTSAYFGDNDTLNFGDGNDLKIFHNGANSFIQDTGTGNLFIDASSTYYRATSHLIQNASSSETLATFTENSSVALYFDNSKKFETSGVGATVYGTLDATQLNVSGVSTFAGAITGTISTATALQNARTFQITGDVVASAISFDGTGNVSLAATIQPNSVALGTDTTGDYVQSISGTSNQITVTSGTGEGSTPTLSIPSQFTAPQDVTVTRDLQVNRNLNVNGNITLGGTTAFINVQELKIADPDLVLGVRTDGSGNDISNDTTANHGGIAVASTEGSPLVSLYNPGIGESTLPTYKKIMWFKSGSFTGLNTDAWLINYAVGIGSTQFPTGTRLAAGSVQFTENDLAVVRNINASGVGTVTNLTSTNATLTNINSSGISTLGVSTFTGTVSFGTSAYFGDNDIAYFGNDNDLRIYHSGTNSLIEHIGTNDLYIKSNNGIYLQNATSEASIYSRPNGAVELYYDNVKEFETTGYGATIFGILQSQGLNISGVSTLGTVQISSGVVTATSGVVTYYGDGSKLTGIQASSIVGVTTYATSAGVATNLKGGLAGNIPYQSAPDTTVFLTNGASGTILQSNGVGNAPTWVAAAPASAITGLTIRDEGTIVGSAASVSTLNFVGAIVSAASTAGIATITFADYVSNAGVSTSVIGGIGSITQLQVTGVSTLGTVQISSGIVTATSGVVTYYGDGSKLSNIISGVSISTNTTNQAQFIPYVISTGSTTGFGVSTSGLVFNPSTGSLGIGTTNPGSKLTVNGSVQIQQDSGSNNRFILRGQPASSYRWNVDNFGSANDFRIFREDDATAANGSVAVSISTTGTLTATKFSGDGSLLTNLPTTSSQWITTAAGIHTLSNVGIGTTNPTSKLTVSGNASITGILTADQVYTSNNNTGQNIRIGDDLWIGDINLANATRFSGAQDSTKAFIVFGTSDTVALGRTGSGPLYYGGDFTISGVATANSFRARGGAPGALGVNNNGYGFFSPGDNDSGMYSSADGQIEFYTNSTEAVRIDSNQRVGIGTTNPTSTLTVQGNARVSGVVTATTFVGALTGTASSATQLVTPRTFQITGDVVASAISFDGTGNVSLAATIQPNSVALGTDTTGDYVTNITGTANQITVTGGTGEGSTPTISIPTNPTLPGNVTIANDLQVNNNLNVTGNITIGGTSAYIISNDFRVRDADIVLGFTTNSSGADVSNDTTANHGGIAVASTEGSPLIQLYNPGIGETNPATYKKIMWFKSGSFTGLNTDAWLINYAVGIGSTQFPNGTRLAVGSVQFTQNDLAVVRNINASGVITATSFSGNASSATYATSAGIATYATSAGIATYATSAGVSTNLKGGSGGSIPYQSAADTTTFLANGSSGQILQSNGGTSAPSWVNAAPAGAITGLTIRDEGTIVGGANSVSQLNFVGNIVSVASTAGIATITFADYVSNAGIATYATTAGIATYATSSGIATYATRAGIATYATTAGIATYAITAGIATNVNGTANRILYNSATNTTSTSANLTFDGGTLGVGGTTTANAFRITSGDRLYIGNDVGTAVTIAAIPTRLVAVGYNVLKNINSPTSGGSNVINTPIAFGEDSLTSFSVDFGGSGSCVVNSQVAIGIGCLSTFNLTTGGGSRILGPNIVMGVDSGKQLSGTVNNVTHQNVIVGYQNVYLNNFYNANNNAIFGIQCGYALTTGADGNALFGYQAGYNVTTGDYNVFTGYFAGYSNVTGSYNIGIGYSAGQANLTGSNNIVIGYNRDVPIAGGNTQLVIGSNTGDWIVGNSSFNVGIGTTNPTSKLTVQGNARVSGVVTATTYDTTYVSTGSVVSTSSTTAQVGIHSALSSTTYRSVEYMVQAAQGTNFHTTKILAVHNGTTAYLTEYGTIYNNSTLANYDVDISGGNIRLLSTPASSGITTYTISFTTTKV